MAMASVVCASREMEPKLIAPVENRFTILAAGSTSSSGTGSSAHLKSISPRMVIKCSFCWLMPSAKVRYSEARLPRTACCKLGHGVRRPGVILAPHPPGVIAASIQHAAIDQLVAIGIGMTPHAFFGNFPQAGAFDRARRCPVKYFSTNPNDSPTASNICAPQ